MKAFGTLKFSSKDDLDDAFDSLDDDEDDEPIDEVREVVEKGSLRKGKVLTFSVDASLSADANVWFQDWLEDVVGAASEGHLDTWQDSFGEAMFVRVHAGGKEEQVDAPFPVQS